MQRTQNAENTNSTGARYDSQSVREILARASELQAEPEWESLTATQVEALGRELGLSPEAVRRALREKVGIRADREVVAEAKGLPPITRRDVKRGVVIGGEYSAIAFLALLAFVLAVARSETFKNVSQYVWLPIVVVGWVYLALGGYIVPFVYAWRRRDWRQGLLVTAPLVPLYAASICLAVVLGNVFSKVSTPLNMDFYPPLALVSIPFGIVGGLLGRWWHDRKLAEDQ